MQKGQVHDLSGDEQSRTGTQSSYSQKREKGPHQGGAAGGSTNTGGWMLLCGGARGCVQVRAPSMGPCPALPLVGHPSPSSLSQHHLSHLGAQIQQVSLLIGGQALRTTVWERLPRIHQVSRTAAPPGGRVRNGLRQNLALFSVEQRTPQVRTAGAVTCS